MTRLLADPKTLAVAPERADARHRVAAREWAERQTIAAACARCGWRLDGVLLEEARREFEQHECEAEENLA